MSALFRAAAAVIASGALGAGAVFGDRALERRGIDLFGGASSVPDFAAPGARTDARSGGGVPSHILTDFAQTQGAATARLEAVSQACGGAFVLRRGGVAGVEHVIAVLAQDGAGPGDEGGEQAEVLRLSAPGDLLNAQAGAGVLRLTSPDGFDGLAWAVSQDGGPRSLGPVRRDALFLPCADPDAAESRFNARSGRAETALR